MNFSKKLIILIMIFILVGCSTKKKVFDGLKYNIQKDDLVREVSSQRPEKFIKQNETGIVKFEVVLPEKRKLKLVGNISAKNLAMVLGYNLKKVLIVTGGSEVLEGVEIDGEFTEEEIKQIFYAYLDSIGYEVFEDDKTVSLVKRSEGVLVTGVFYVPLVNIRVGKVKEIVVSSVKVVSLGRGVILIGNYGDLVRMKSLIKVVDADGSGEVLLDFVRVRPEIVKKYNEIMLEYRDKYGAVRILEMSNDVVCVLGNVKKEIEQVVSVLTLMNENSKKSLFVVPVFMRNIVDLDKLIKKVVVFDYIVDVENSRFVVASGYSDYLLLSDYVRLLDREDKQVLVRVFIVDLKKSLTEDFGLDVNIDRGGLDVISKLRESVGVGIVGEIKDLKVFVNMLKERFEGRVLQSPLVNMRNNTDSVVHFGERVPVLKATQNVVISGEIIESVEYLNIGLNLNLNCKICGDKILIKMSVDNSGALEKAGFGGNPQFTTDSLTVEFFVKNGMASVISGLKRLNREKKRKGVVPYVFGSLFDKDDMREFVVCVQAEIVKVEQDNIDLINNLMK